MADSISRRLVQGLARIGVAMKSQAWQAATDRGLTPTQGQILAVLRARDPAAMRLSEVAEALAVTPATASDAITSLAGKGLVAKTRSESDGRSLAVVLTAKGRREAARVEQWPDFLLGAVDSLTGREQEVFLLALVKMIRMLQEQGRIPVARMCVTCQYFRPAVHDDAERPHHCAYVDAPFGVGDLRLECPDHQAAPPELAAAGWQSFLISIKEAS